MKNIAIINTVDRASTGKIGKGLLKNFLAKGYNAYFFYGRGEKTNNERQFIINGKFEAKLHVVLGKIFGLADNFSCFATRRLVAKLRKLKIDTVYIISPHGFYLNENIFYDYIQKDDIHLIYTMIDEYPYLGKCTNEAHCEKWKTGKGTCPEIRRYPASLFFDTCSYFIRRKSRNYSRAPRLLFVGPQFLVDRSKDAYLRRYMNMIPLDEFIDLDFYKPQDATELKKKLGIDDSRKIVLFAGGPSKGPGYFTELALRFAEDKDYVFVHVGYPKEQETALPSNYIPIGYVKNDSEFAMYYSMADLFVFPSMRDCMPNTCLEALACGTPLLIFNISGMPYLIDNTVGNIVPPGDVDAMEKIVRNLQKKTKQVVETCRKYAEKRYNGEKYIEKLIEITLIDEKKN